MVFKGVFSPVLGGIAFVGWFIPVGFRTGSRSSVTTCPPIAGFPDRLESGTSFGSNTSEVKSGKSMMVYS